MMTPVDYFDMVLSQYESCPQYQLDMLRSMQDYIEYKAEKIDEPIDSPDSEE